MIHKMQYNQRDVLCHYGVKGMKWGVRKEYEPVGRKTTHIKQDKNLNIV